MVRKFTGVVKMLLRSLRYIPPFCTMLSEIVSRRIAHDEWPMADYIVVDGGKGQVRAIQNLLGFRYFSGSVMNHIDLLFRTTGICG